MRYICLSRVDLWIQLNKFCQSENVTFDQIVIFAIFSHCSYTSSSPVVSYPDTRGTDRRVMKAVTVSLKKWGVNPLLIAGIFPVPILSLWQFQVLVPFQRQPQPPAVPALARRWPHHIAPNGAIVDRAQVSSQLIYMVNFKHVLSVLSCVCVFGLLFRLWCVWVQSSEGGAFTDGWMGRGQPSGTTSPWPRTRGKLRGRNASPCPQGKYVSLQFVNLP